jgi:hypothetical protein
MNVRFNAISGLVHVGRALLMWLPIGMFFALGFEHGSLVAADPRCLYADRGICAGAPAPAAGRANDCVCLNGRGRCVRAVSSTTDKKGPPSMFLVIGGWLSEFSKFEQHHYSAELTDAADRTFKCRTCGLCRRLRAR